MTTVSCQQSPNNEDRVATAIAEKSDIIVENLTKNHLKKDDFNILLVAFKDLDKLELYAKKASDSSYKRIQTYPVCARSGILGPKKKEGDKQVPEGFYSINRFNPKSLFYLSLGLNYPNNYDTAQGYTGSDIFIHGKCQTVGCLPMTDDLIKEIYLYALWAKDNGQNDIPVYIFPFEMTEQNMLKHQKDVDENTYAFWTNIQEGYTKFNRDFKKLSVAIDSKKYIFE